MTRAGNYIRNRQRKRETQRQVLLGAGWVCHDMTSIWPGQKQTRRKHGPFLLWWPPGKRNCRGFTLREAIRKYQGAP